MSTKQNQTKSKLSEVAKDLKISNQELSDFISDKFGTVKKPSASITQDELNYILESFSQNNQVDSFNPYFESRNNKPEPKKEEKPADKKPAPAKKQEKPAAKKDCSQGYTEGSCRACKARTACSDCKACCSQGWTKGRKAC